MFLQAGAQLRLSGLLLCLLMTLGGCGAHLKPHLCVFSLGQDFVESGCPSCFLSFHQHILVKTAQNSPPPWLGLALHSTCCHQDHLGLPLPQWGMVHRPQAVQ